MKNYTKLDYASYRSNCCVCNDESYYLGEILALCYEFLGEEVRDVTLQAVLNYKFYLTSQSKTKKPEYLVCDEILSTDFRDLSHKEIAMKFGYYITKNPRYGTCRETLKAFESDIAQGCLNSSVDYSGEYFSIVYDLFRRSLIIQSVMWKNSNDMLVKDAKSSIADRLKVFDKFFDSQEDIPVFMEKFRSSIWVKGTDFFDLCYSQGIYESWIQTWTGYTGKPYFEWTRQDQIWWDPTWEGNEQFIDFQVELINTLSCQEISYVIDLCIYSACSYIWKYLNSDIKITELNKGINKLIQRLEKLGECNKMLSELKSLNGIFTDIAKLESIIGWKIFLE